MLKEVRELSALRLISLANGENPRLNPIEVETAVLAWLRSKFKSVRRAFGFPDFIAVQNGRSFGFEVKTLRFAQNGPKKLKEMMEKSVMASPRRSLSEMVFVFVTSRVDVAQDAANMLSQQNIPEMPNKIRILVGCLEHDEEGGGEFQLISTIMPRPTD
jgi:hypothetical protein